jgi:hypothetical protein
MKKAIFEGLCKKNKIAIQTNFLLKIFDLKVSKKLKKIEKNELG